MNSEALKPAQPTPRDTAIGCAVLMALLIVASVVFSMCSGGEGSGPGDPALLKSETVALWRNFLTVAARCDGPSQAAAELGLRAAQGGASIVDAYGAAKGAKDTCMAVYTDLGSLEPPKNARGDVRVKFNDALESCRTAYLYKVTGMESLAKILNGGATPENLLSYRDDAQRGQARQLVCVTSYFSAAQAAGVEVGQLNGP